MPPQDVLRRRFFVHGGDRIYIYPDNLNAKATLWLWQLRDLAVIGIGLLIAVLTLTQLGLFLPMVLVAAYALHHRTANFRVGGPDMKKQKKDKRRQSTQNLLGIRKITDYCISTDAGDLVFYIIKPTNISVLPAGAISAKIRALQNTLSAQAGVELLAMNSRESFNATCLFYHDRMQEESNPAIKRLLEQDRAFLDEKQVQMTLAREFYLAVRLKNEKPDTAYTLLSTIETKFRDNGFTTRRAGKDDLKRLLAIYFEQNTTTERFEDYDGQRFLEVV